MSPSPYTLVYRARGRDASPNERRVIVEPGLLENFHGGALQGAFIGALAGSITSAIATQGGPFAGAGVARVFADLKRAPRVQRVGLWDIGARVARLPAIIERLNASQPKITLFHVHAPVPAGLVRSAPDMIAWLEGFQKYRISKADREEIQDNFLVQDFYAHADRVRRELGLDYLIGISGLMLAGEEDRQPYWNYFATGSDRTLMVSAYNLATYAQKANRPYEAAVAGIAVSILLATLNPKIEYHPDTRGCLFDFNAERASIVKALRDPHIDHDCLRALFPAYRESAIALLDALREYDPAEPRVENA